jgi:hypothetical protein
MDLFDLDRALTPAERKKLTRRDPIPKGYIAMPGSGPAGETCGSCKHLVRKQMSKTYLKCALASSFWTGGRGSDVLARSPACKRWEAP